MKLLTPEMLRNASVGNANTQDYSINLNPIQILLRQNPVDLTINRRTYEYGIYDPSIGEEDDKNLNLMLANITKQQEEEEFWEPEEAPVNKFVPIQLESPYRGTNYEHTEFNKKYAEACLRDCLKRGETAMASHLLFTGATNDMVAEERAMGIEAGLKFLEFAKYSVVYIDLGITYGMKQGIKRAKSLYKEIIYRVLPDFDGFLSKNSSLLNGYSHIVGDIKEYTLKDAFIDFLYLNNCTEFGYFKHTLDRDTRLVYGEFQFPLCLLGDDLQITYSIGYVPYSKSADILKIEREYRQISPLIDKFKLYRKLNLNMPLKQKKSKVNKI